MLSTALVSETASEPIRCLGALLGIRSVLSSRAKTPRRTMSMATLDPAVTPGAVLLTIALRGGRGLAAAKGAARSHGRTVAACDALGYRDLLVHSNTGRAAVAHPTQGPRQAGTSGTVGAQSAGTREHLRLVAPRQHPLLLGGRRGIAQVGPDGGPQAVATPFRRWCRRLGMMGDPKQYW